MPDLFISYSRRDQEFVRRLADELERRGKDTWVDWDDIPPTADWLARIKAGIEGSNAFVYVISPDSVASVVCGEEVTHATELGKRVVPVLLRPVDPATAPSVVSAHNWISFADGTDFVTATDTLVAAVDTDLPWLEGHTRWLERAHEWTRHDRDDSFLLRGAELTAAERWMAGAQGAQKDPPVTPLQYEHIIASRRATTRRARRLTGALVAGLVLALALAAVAVWQSFEAVDQRDRATARELVATSALNLDRDPELSVELAARAARLRGGPETEQALRRALLESYARARIAVPGGAQRAEFVAGGERLLTSGAGVARLWDVRTRRQLHEFAGSDDSEQAAASADGRRVLTVSTDEPIVRLWSAEDGSLVHELRAGPPGLVGGSFSADGGRVVTSASDGAARVWNAEDGELLGRFGRGPDLVSAAFSPGGERLVTADRTGVVAVWDLRTSERLLRLPHPGNAAQARFTPDGSKVVVLLLDAAAGVVYDAGGGFVRRIPKVATGWRSVALSPDGKRLVTGGADGAARIWRLGPGEPLPRLQGHLGQVPGAAISPDGRLAATVGAEGTARIWELETGRELGVLRGHRGGVTGVAFDERGGTVATVGLDGDVRVWAAGPPGVTGSERDLAPAEGRAATAGAPGPGGTVVVGDEGGGVELFDPRDGRRVRSLGPLDGEVWHVAAAPGGRVLAASRAEARLLDAAGREAVADARPGEYLMEVEPLARRPGLITRWEDGVGRIRVAGAQPPGDATGIAAVAAAPGGDAALAGGGEVALVDVGTGKARKTVRAAGRGDTMVLAFSRSGDRLLVATDDRHAVYDGALERRLRTVEPGPEPTIGGSFAFTPDGRRYATTNGGPGVTVRRSDDAKVLAELDLAVDGELSFGGDGDFLLADGADGWTRVVEVASKEVLLRVRGDGPHWLADGRRFTTVDDGAVRVWLCEACAPLPELLRLAERRVTRPLTDEERARYDRDE